MEKKKLEKMLDAVKDVKSQFYVGTFEAWTAIRAMEMAYSGPLLIAQGINDRLSPREITYQATPERVYGVYDILEEARRRIVERANYEEVAEILEQRCASCVVSNFFLGEIDESRIQKAIKFYHPFFAAANNAGIDTDAEFPFIIATTWREVYKEVRDTLEIDQRNDCDDYVETCAEEISRASLVDSAMARKELTEGYIGAVKMILQNQLSRIAIVKRLQRDRYDKRLEYRRALLAKVLTEKHSDSQEANLMELVFGINAKYAGIKRDWAYYIQNYYRKIQERKKEISELGSLQADDTKRLHRTDKLLEEIETDQFILEIINQEKNWIERFLKG